MATRSTVTAKMSDGTYRTIYCHWDGYPKHNGRILLQCYSTQEAIEKLVAPGNISVLAESCDKPAGHSFDKPVKGYTVYYGRDRGEADNEPSSGPDPLSSMLNNGYGRQQYNYLWNGEGWLVDGAELTPAMCGMNAKEEMYSRADRDAEKILNVIDRQDFADFYTGLFEEYITGDLEIRLKDQAKAKRMVIDEIKTLFKIQ
jgi:hypothetical protein